MPLALGALRFDRRADGVLFVPEVTVVAGAGRTPSIVLVGTAERVDVLLGDLLSGRPEHLPEIVTGAHVREPTPPPDEFRLTSARPHQDFLNRVSAAVAEIRSGRLDKVVLAREVTVHANRPLRQADLLGRLRALHPSCTAFAIDGFIGATPELLIRRDGARIALDPLAGTAARSGDAEADRRAEAATAWRLPRSAPSTGPSSTPSARRSPRSWQQLEVPERPAIVELRNVSHLGTSITGTLARRDGDFPSALELVGLLHPTPAVAGTPVDLALDYLAKLEELDRDRYAGPVGWVDARSDGEWHLGIRSAIVEGNAARLFAGVGIVADSDPSAGAGRDPAQAAGVSRRRRPSLSPGREGRVPPHDLGDDLRSVEREQVAPCDHDELRARHVLGESAGGGESGTMRSDAPVTTAVGTASRHSARSIAGVSPTRARCSTRKLCLRPTDDGTAACRRRRPDGGNRHDLRRDPGAGVALGVAGGGDQAAPQGSGPGTKDAAPHHRHRQQAVEAGQCRRRRRPSRSSTSAPTRLGVPQGELEGDAAAERMPDDGHGALAPRGLESRLQRVRVGGDAHRRTTV